MYRDVAREVWLQHGADFEAAHTLQSKGWWCRWKFGIMRAFKPNAMTLHDRDVMGALPGIQQVILDRPIASARAHATSSKTKLFSLEQFHATPADDEQKRFQDAAEKAKTQKEDSKEDIRVVHCSATLPEAILKSIVEKVYAPAKFLRKVGPVAIMEWPKGEGVKQRRATEIGVAGVGLFQVGLPARPDDVGPPLP